MSVKELRGVQRNKFLGMTMHHKSLLMCYLSGWDHKEAFYFLAKMQKTLTKNSIYKTLKTIFTFTSYQTFFQPKNKMHRLKSFIK
jgi:hypothetical protein